MSHINLGVTTTIALATAFWTAAGGLMVAGTMTGSDITVDWGLFLGLIGCMLVGYLIASLALRAERLRLERLVQVMLGATQEADVSPLRRDGS